MIQVIGSTQLSFMFPADRATAYAYYQDMGRIVGALPHIQMVQDWGNGRYRLAYDTIELGAYHIRILCDVEREPDPTFRLLRFVPVVLPPDIPAQAGFNSATTRGNYASESHFSDEGGQTRIEYHLNLQAELPSPLALRVLPGIVLNKISDNVTRWRIKEIAGGFIENTIARFPLWLQEQKGVG